MESVVSCLRLHRLNHVRMAVDLLCAYCSSIKVSVDLFRLVFPNDLVSSLDLRHSVLSS